jgi:ketosteroid isomerase-like protein
MKSKRKDLSRTAMITLACISLASLGMLAISAPPDPRVTDENTIRDLNQKYINAFMHSDVEWYRAILAEDFVCIDSDGSILHKTEFLKQAAKAPEVISYELEKVDVRFYGDVALVQATGKFTRRDGTLGYSHYTDIYVHKGEDWKVVSAQITRSA